MTTFQVLPASGSNYHPFFRYYHPVNHPVLGFYQWPTISEDFHRNTSCWTHIQGMKLFLSSLTRSKNSKSFPSFPSQFLLHRIAKNNTTPKQTWISLTLFADSMRQTPTERQNPPMRKKLERTDSMVSWGFQAGSFCCLNALLSGHLEGRTSPSCGERLVLFFIFFLVRGKNNILVLESV